MKVLALAAALAVLSSAAALPFGLNSLFDSRDPRTKLVRRSAQIGSPVSDPANSPAFGANVAQNVPIFESAIESNLVEPSSAKENYFDVRLNPQSVRQKIPEEFIGPVDAEIDTLFDTSEPQNFSPSDSLIPSEEEVSFTGFGTPKSENKNSFQQGQDFSVSGNVQDSDQIADPKQPTEASVESPTVQKQVSANEPQHQELAGAQSPVSVVAYPDRSSSFDVGSQSVSSPAEHFSMMANAHPFSFSLPFPGGTPSQYTALDLSQVDFSADAASSGHKEYLSVVDGSGESELYQLLGVAPRAAAQGGAQAYSASMGESVPVYRELDDDEFYWQSAGLRSSAAQLYSAAFANSQFPVQVKAQATLSGQQVVLLLDD